MVDSIPKCTHFGIHSQRNRKLSTNSRKHWTTINNNIIIAVTFKFSTVDTGKQFYSSPWVTSSV